MFESPVIENTFSKGHLSIALGFYNHWLRDILLHQKLAPHPTVARTLAQTILAKANERFRSSRLIWVPEGAFRSAHLVEVLSLELCRLGWRSSAVQLAKKARSKPQKLLRLEDRKQSQSRFRIQRNPSPETIVLLDDIHTTGATLTECADLLESAGHTVVGAITLAYTPCHFQKP